MCASALRVCFILCFGEISKRNSRLQSSSEWKICMWRRTQRTDWPWHQERQWVCGLGSRDGEEEILRSWADTAETHHGVSSAPQDWTNCTCKQTFISSCFPVTPSLLCLFLLLFSLHLIPLWPRTKAMATVVKLEVLMDEGLPGVSNGCGVIQGHTVSGTLQTL